MLVTGSTGFLGRHLAEVSENGRWQWVAPPSRALDVRDRARVLREVPEWRPNVVVHLAYRRDDARTIVEGSANVAEAAARCGARLIHVSTDMVFEGREWAYTELDRPDASIDYGRWKAQAEERVALAHTSALILRTSLLYGTDRLGQPQLDVHDRPDITWFTDEYRCPAHAADVARAICTLADRREITGSLHVAGPDALSRAGFAHAIAGWLGLSDGAVRTSSLAASGLHRPGRIILDSSKAASLGITCRSIRETLPPIH
jgi:dTDP-4-dehydrorhamnose reductase